LNSLQEFLEIYTANPCRTLPNAFWKTAGSWSETELRISRDPAGVVTSLVLKKDQRLMAFWCADSGKHPLSQEKIEHTPFALVHADGLPIFSGRKFAHRRAYFRLINQGHSEKALCPPGFTFQVVNPKEDIDAIADFICDCYTEIKVSSQIVRTWTGHFVYDPELWVWVVHQASGVKVGLGIAERDPRVPEASLEWVQVHPAYRGKGLGKALVNELSQRALEEVAFLTVSGEVESESQPEQLYRSCGFTGDDVWWLLYDEI